MQVPKGSMWGHRVAASQGTRSQESGEPSMSRSCGLKLSPWISKTIYFRPLWVQNGIYSLFEKRQHDWRRQGSAYIITLMIRSTPPPPGFYVPAVLFFDKNEDLDIPSIQAHVLRLAQVSFTALSFFFPNLIMTGWCDWDSSSRIQWRGPASVACLHPFPVVRSQAITLDRTMNATRPSHWPAQPLTRMDLIMFL